MFNRLAKEKTFCGLDLGERSIKVSLINVSEDRQMELIGAFEGKAYGFKDGSVTDLGELAECIHRAIQELADKLNVRVRGIHVGVGGELVSIREASAVIPLVDRGNKVITEKDIAQANQHVRILGVKMDEEALHDFPQMYRVDDVNSALNPRGLFGRKLGVRSLLVVSLSNKLRNITNAIHQAGFDVADISFSPYAASSVTLDDEEKLKGAVLIDMGALSTSVLIFRDRQLQFLNQIPIGGSHMTCAIAEKLQLPLELAEDIKKSYASAADHDVNGEEELLVKRDSGYVPVRRKLVSEAINGLITQLIGDTLSMIKTSGHAEHINKGLTLVGGGAFLPGLVEQMALASNFPTKLANLKIKSKKQLTNNALFASSIGLARISALKGLPEETEVVEKLRWFDNLTSKFKELYQEYF